MVLASCGNTPYLPNQEKVLQRADLEARIQHAEELIQQHRLYDALVQYQVLNTIDPRSTTFKNKLAALTEETKKKSKHFEKLANKFKHAGNVNAARNALLKALSYEPRNRSLLHQVRSLEQQRVMSVQIAKLDRIKGKRKKTVLATAEEKVPEHVSDPQESAYLEMGTELYGEGDWEGSVREISKYLASNSEDEKAQQLLLKSLMNLAQEQISSGEMQIAAHTLLKTNELPLPNEVKIENGIRRLKLSLAESLYEKGVKSYREDLTLAIKHLKLASDLDPSHRKAKIRLKKAYQLEQRLKSIVDSGS
ncbi:MAG: hypothetical protein OEX00_08380 [Gammaproteobacteria bacterium]|nr:hypothetical protein [Gammaproteobacteria bacterium]